MSVQITNGIFDQNELDIRYEVRLPILKDQNCRPRPPHHPEEPEHKPEHPHKPSHPCPSNNYIKISGYVDCVGRLPMVIDKNEIWLVGSEMYIYLGINKGDKGTPNVAWKLLGSIAYQNYISKDQGGNLLPIATLNKSGFMSSTDKQLLVELVNLGIIKTEQGLTPIATEDSNGFMSSEDKRKLDSLSNSGDNYIEVTWKTLKSYVDNNKLTPGATYRLIDYEFTPADMKNYRHCPDVKFDLLLTALTNNVLDERATTISEDPNLTKLNIKYNLTNDTDKFEIANGGIIHHGVTRTDVTKIGSRHPLTALAYGNGVYVGISEGYSYVSRDLKTWTVHELIDKNSQWNDIIFKDEKFLVCGYSNIIASSSDGIEWDEVDRYYDIDESYTPNYKCFVERSNGSVDIIPTMSNIWLYYDSGSIYRSEGINVSFNKCKEINGELVMLTDTMICIGNQVYNLPTVSGDYVDFEFTENGIIFITNCGIGYFTNDITLEGGFCKFELPNNASAILTENQLTLITCNNHSDKLYRLDFIEDNPVVSDECDIALGSYNRIYYINKRFYLLGTTKISYTTLDSSEIGKGIIYEMSDRFNNTLRYDYKSAQVKHYKSHPEILEGNTGDVDYDWMFTFTMKDTFEDASSLGKVLNVTQEASLSDRGKYNFEFNIFELKSYDYIINLTYVRFEDNFIGCTVKDVKISPKRFVRDCIFSDLFDVIIEGDIMNCIATEAIKGVAFVGGRLSNVYLDGIKSATDYTENPIIITTVGNDTHSTISWLDNETQALQYRSIFGPDSSIGSGYYYGSGYSYSDIDLMTTGEGVMSDEEVLSLFIGTV